MAKRTVVVLGGGVGGQVVAKELRRNLPRSDRVVLVEKNAIFSFAPSYLWVMSGARRPAQVSATLARLQRAGVELMRAEVLALEPDERRVQTSRGELQYDRLVVALGAQLAPEALPGFAEAAHNVYTLEGVIAAGHALHAFEGGRVAVLVSRLPYKCPAAPYEAAFLTEAVLRRCGVRGESTVNVYTPEPMPMPTAGVAVGQALVGMLAARGITFNPGTTVDRIDAGGHELVLSSGQRIGYDLLVGVPPHRPPELVKGSGLVQDSGYIPVDPATLATAVDGVYAVGDVTTVPLSGGKMLPKAGVFAHGEAEVVARRIAAELAGEQPSARFEGKGGCFVELGDGIAAYATGDFYAAGGPQVNMRRPGRIWHWSKLAFEQYWLRIRL